MLHSTTPLVPLQYLEHASKGWKRFDSYSFASASTRAPIATPEVASVVLSYPIAFEASDAGMRLVVVLGIDVERNLFVNDDGRWLGRYVPAYFRSFPFMLSGVDSQGPESSPDPARNLPGTADMSNDRRELLVYQSEMLPVERSGVTPFFADRDFHPMVVETMAFLRRFQQGVDGVGRIGEKLSELQVLRPWMIEAKDANPTSHPSQSTEASSSDFRVESADPPTLYCVDETRLNALSDEDWLVLRHHGALPIAFAQLMSMGQLATLRQLHKLRAEDAGLLASSPASKRQVSNAGEDSLRDFIDAVVQSK
jgi:hypothetical protein